MQCSQYCARPAKTADCGLVQPCATQDHEWKKAHLWPQVHGGLFFVDSGGIDRTYEL